MGRLWLFAILLLAFASRAPAQTRADAPETTPSKVPAYEQQLADLPKSGLTDPQQTEAKALLENALQQARLADQFRDRAKSFATNQQEFQASLQGFQKRLDEDDALLAGDAATTMPLPAVEERLNSAKKIFDDAVALAARVASRQTEQSARRATVATELPKAVARLEEARRLAAEPLPAGPEPLAAARRADREASFDAAAAEVESLRAEDADLSRPQDQVSSDHDAAASFAERAKETVAQWQEVAKNARQRDATRTAASALAAQRQALSGHPAVLEVAQTNRNLADERLGPKGIVARLNEGDRAYDEVTSQAAGVSQLASAVEQRLAIAGMSEGVGLLLRRARAELPSAFELERQISELQQEIPMVQLRILELGELRAKLASSELRTSEILEAHGEAGASDEVVSSVRTLVLDQRTLLDSLIADYKRHASRLAELEIQKRLLLDQTQDLAAKIDERVLWIRSNPAFRPSDAASAASVFTRPFRTGSAVEMVRRSTGSLADRPLLAFGLVLALAAIVLLPRKLEHRLEAINEQAISGRRESLSASVHGLFVVFLLAARWPAFLYLLGELAASPANPVEVAVPLSRFLKVAAGLTFALQTVLIVCRPRGFGDAHLNMSPRAMARVYSSLRLMGPVYLVGQSVAAAARTVSDSGTATAPVDSLGRAALVVSLAALAWAMWSILRPSKAAAGGAGEAPPPGPWAQRGRMAGLALLVGLPLALLVMTVAGYYYTASELSVRLIRTIRLGVFVYLFYVLMLRALHVFRRNILLQKVLDGALGPAVAASGARDMESREDSSAEEFANFDRQSRRFVTLLAGVVFAVGLAILWMDILPALRFLDRPKFTLWTYTEQVSETMTLSDGSKTTRMTEQPQAVTAATLIFALGIALLTLAAARNVPGFLEILVLQRLPMDRAARYAATTIVNYVIVIGGLAYALNMLGIGWSSIQWIAAAAAVGLGFGLQEIFANFISGLIILFERPVRIGDVVTVSGTTGRVLRIRMRATTIVDWDNKELIVPNKQIITETVLNWTLSDSIVRQEYKIGVAYGTDPDLVRRTLLEIAHAHPEVLKEPAPHAFFESFGDSTLNFVMRLHLPSLENGLEVRHAINREIAEAFAAHGITMAFPQMDLNMKITRRDKETGELEIRGTEGKPSPPEKPTST